MCLLPDGWCLEAFTLAQGRMMEELTNVLIMLVVGKVCVLWGLLKVIFQNSGFLCVGRSVLSTTFFPTWPKGNPTFVWCHIFGHPNKIYNKEISTHISPLDVRFQTENSTNIAFHLAKLFFPRIEIEIKSFPFTIDLHLLFPFISWL